MTVYRYVRMGRLSAIKSGSQWRVALSDLETFKNRERTVGDIDAPWAERLEARMIAGDAGGAWLVVEAALAAGRTPLFIYSDVLAPAMSSIGHRWERGELDVADEHLATAVALRVVGRLGPRFSRRGRTRGRVLCAMPEGDQHSLSSVMVADVIRSLGFETLDLGANTPPPALVKAVERLDGLEAICLSITNHSALDSARAMVDAVREIEPDLSIIAGGRAIRSDEDADRLGVDGWGVKLTDAIDLVEAITAGPSQAAISVPGPA